MPSRQLSIAVVGANFPNKDGGNRRSEIAFCDPGEVVELRPEPKNEFDEHAIAVFSARHFQIGYVASQRAVFLGSLIRSGQTLSAIFQDLAPWGAIVRVGINCAPVLPVAGEADDEPDEFAQEDPGFYPDPEPED